MINTKIAGEEVVVQAATPSKVFDLIVVLSKSLDSVSASRKKSLRSSVARQAIKKRSKRA